MSNIKLTLILPCYNEEEHFRISAEKIYSVLTNTSIPFEIIFAEDKSKDNTRSLIEEFLQDKQDSRLQTFFHNTNQGRGRTVNDGIAKAQGEFVGFIDIDCEISPVYIPECLRILERGEDVVCADRRYEIDPSGIVRALASKIYAFLVKWFFETHLKDTEAGYKFFRRDKITDILPKVENQGWFWDTELMVRSELAGLKIVFLPVLFKRRHDKTSTVRLIPDTLEYLRELKRFKNELKANEREIHQFWWEQAPAFTHQYKTYLGIPLSPVGWFLKTRFRKIFTILNKVKGKFFLDIGCGSGVYMEMAINLGKHATGIDYSENMLKLAQASLQNYPPETYQLLKGEAQHLPVSSASFDLVLASGLTDYLSKLQTHEFLKETKRVLKKGGTAILTFPKSESPFVFLRRGLGLKLRKFFLQLPPQKSAFSKIEVETLLKEMGFKIKSWGEVMNTMYIVVCEKT